MNIMYIEFNIFFPNELIFLDVKVSHKATFKGCVVSIGFSFDLGFFTFYRLNRNMLILAHKSRSHLNHLNFTHCNEIRELTVHV